MDWREEFIKQSKQAVNEFIRILKADILFDDLEDETKGKAALSTKKEAFVEAKNIIANLLDIDHSQQDWARITINELIDAGNESVDGLISGIGNDINLLDGISNDANDLKNAIKSRGVAFKDALELIDAVSDLKRIVAEDEIVIRDNDFNAGHAEMYADKYKKISDKSGYDSKIDAIILDPDGTVGDIIELCDLRIALPKRPVRKKIQNHNRKTKDQYFRREEPPRGLSPKSAKRYEDYIDQEYSRKRKGFWFLNNGKYEYITGAHYFLMTYYKIVALSGYYYFTKAQQKLFWLLEAAWVDQRSYGIILEKIRRFGATDSGCAFMTAKGVTTRGGIFGHTSKTDADARANFTRMTYAFSNLPFYMKPICLDEKSKTKLEFSIGSQKLSKKNKDKQIVDNSLNTRMDFMPTKEDSYDGTALDGYMADEFSKWGKANGNTITHWEMVRKALTKGMRITGKAFILSTVENVTGLDPYDEPKECEAGDRYKWLYYNSDPTQRDDNGRTLTGLYKVFISCYEHYEGLIDRYGYPITDDPEKTIVTIDGKETTIGIKTYIDNESTPFKNNPRALYEYFRKTPINEEDGFRIAEGTCMFNQVNILAQVAYNDKLPFNEKFRSKRIPNCLRIGNFYWKDGQKDCDEVIWRDEMSGRFKIAWMPPTELQNNKYYRGSIRYPANKDIGAFGVDPYRVNKTVDNKGSKGAMHGFTKHNSKGAPNDFFFLEYICRPETKDIFQDDMIKAMVFYGMPALIENNVNSLLEEMFRRGYRHYSLKRPDKAVDKLTFDEEKYGGIPSNSENVLQMQASVVENYVEQKVGEVDPDEFGEMFFNQTLYDWLAFDIKDRTKRDATISSSLALIACNSYRKRPVDINKNQKAIKAYIKQYNNMGVIGYS